MWKSVSNLVTVTKWEEMKDLVKALELVSLKMSSSEEDHAVRCLKYRAHALQICSKRKSLFEEEEAVNVLCDLARFDFKARFDSKDEIVRKSLHVIGSTMYNIGAPIV